MKKALVCGAGGFIASHLVRRLKEEGHWVRGADLKVPEFAPTAADDFRVLDLREPDACEAALSLDSDRKSTRLNSSHLVISYAVFCLKKKRTGQAAHTLSGREQ